MFLNIKGKYEGKKNFRKNNNKRQISFKST